MVKTGLGGMVATVVDVIALVNLVEVARLPIMMAVFVAACAGAACGFVIAKFWAFRDRRPLAVQQVASYAAVAVGGALLVSISVHVLVILGAAYVLAKLVAAVGVFALWSYPAQSRWVFA